MAIVQRAGHSAAALPCRDVRDRPARPRGPGRRAAPANATVPSGGTPPDSDTGVVGVFPDRESCDRLVGALLVDVHEQWQGDLRQLNMNPSE